MLTKLEHMSRAGAAVIKGNQGVGMPRRLRAAVIMVRRGGGGGEEENGGKEKRVGSGGPHLSDVVS